MALILLTLNMYVYKVWMHSRIFLMIIKSYRMRYCPTLKMGRLYSLGPPQRILPFKSTVPCSVDANSLCLRNWRAAILRKFWKGPVRIFQLTFSGRMKKSRKMMSMSTHFILIPVQIMILIQIKVLYQPNLI